MDRMLWLSKASSVVCQLGCSWCDSSPAVMNTSTCWACCLFPVLGRLKQRIPSYPGLHTEDTVSKRKHLRMAMGGLELGRGEGSNRNVKRINY